MIEKVMAFITDGTGKFLLLHNNPVDPKHGGDIWYTVTGGVENYDANFAAAAIREVKEETDLETIKITDLDWQIDFMFDGKMNREHVFLVEVPNSKITLDTVENIDYKWLPLDDFLNQIYWYGDSKQDLIRKLKK